MSLLRQLWLTVVAAMLVAWAGCLAVSVLSARHYLEQQLYAQASDNAAGLALSMSQQKADPATAELLIAALFDSGHFDSIAYRDAQGRMLVERRFAGRTEDVPGWFVQLIALTARPGEARVSQGWRQAGTVTVVANNRYAYVSLWEGSLRVAAWLAAAGILWGLAVTALIGWIRRPLGAMVAQAEAIGERRFHTVQEPRVTELKAIARAMNAMGTQVEAMFAEQSQRIDELRNDANRDPVTGIANRGFFLGRLRGALHDERMPAAGGLVLIRIADLAALNRGLGREAADQRLRALGQTFARMVADRADSAAARLNGSDFALLLPGADPALIQQLNEACQTVMEDLYVPGQGAERLSGLAGFVAAAVYRHGESEGSVLARADVALMNAEAGIPTPAVAPDAAAAYGIEDWRRMLDEAQASQSFELAAYPVIAGQGKLLHAEAMLRLVRNGQRLTAGQFMPPALRLGRIADLDTMTVSLALQRLRAQSAELAVNVSAQSVAQAGFRQRLIALLAQHPQEARRLWIEIGEQGLSENLSELTELSAALQPLGCRLGIEHFGRHLAAIPRLHRVRIDYLKLDGSFVVNIDTHAGNQRFVKAVVDVGRSLGLYVIAERVHTQAEWKMLEQLGVAAFTGPAVTAAAG
jgi:diguanylate cyclase (GGDEF)-like protein